MHGGGAGEDGTGLRGGSGRGTKEKSQKENNEDNEGETRWREDPQATVAAAAAGRIGEEKRAERVIESGERERSWRGE